MSDVQLDNPYGEVSSVSLTQQRCEIRLLRWKGSWVMNPDKGIPYLTFNARLIAETAQAELAEVPGVESVTTNSISDGNIDITIYIAEPTGTDLPSVVEQSNFQFKITYERYNNAI